MRLSTREPINLTKLKHKRYIFSTDPDNCSVSGAGYWGKLTSNFMGTNFTIFDRGERRSQRVEATHERRSDGEHDVVHRVRQRPGLRRDPLRVRIEDVAHLDPRPLFGGDARGVGDVDAAREREEGALCSARRLGVSSFVDFHDAVENFRKGARVLERRETSLDVRVLQRRRRAREHVVEHRARPQRALSQHVLHFDEQQRSQGSELAVGETEVGELSEV